MKFVPTDMSSELGRLGWVRLGLWRAWAEDHSVVIKLVLTDITSDGRKFGWVRLNWVRLCLDTDAYVQKIMRNGAVILLHIQQLRRRHFRTQEMKTLFLCKFISNTNAFFYCITSMTNSIKIPTVIIHLLNACRQISLLKFRQLSLQWLLGTQPAVVFWTMFKSQHHTQ
jgi:hypothetical protein